MAGSTALSCFNIDCQYKVLQVTKVAPDSDVQSQRLLGALVHRAGEL